MLDQKIVSIDSQVLSSIQLCPRLTQYRFIEQLATETKAEALENGSLMHDMLEIYYSLASPVITEYKSDAFIRLRESGITVPDNSNPAEIATKAGRYFATKTDLDISEVEDNIYQFKEYTEYYKHDNFIPLVVEGVATKVLYEDEELKIIYNGKMDLVGEFRNGVIMPIDHKTSKKRSYPNDLNNQFMGYSFLVAKPNVMVNKIGFQKTLQRSERFSRDILTYTQDRIDEWVSNSVYWVRVLLNHIESSSFPMNLTSCDKYSGCDYREICGKDSGTREWIKQRDFVKSKKWDVASILEAA